MALDTYNQSVGPVAQTLRDPNGTFGDALPAVFIPETADPICANEQRTFDNAGNNAGKPHNLIAYGIRSDATREGTAKTPGPDANGVVRLRDPGLGITEELAPTVDASQPHVVAYPIQECNARQSKDQNGPGIGIASPQAPMYTLQAGAQHGVAITVPEVAPCLRSNPHNNSDATMEAQMLVPFDTTQVTSHLNRSEPKAGDPCHPLAAHGHPPAVAFTQNQCGDVLTGDVMPAMGTNSNATGRNTPKVQASSMVRRLTPTECLRLQGMPDGYLDITYRGKPAADGPKYRAIGNSIAVPCLAWVGRRIEIVETALRAQ